MTRGDRCACPIRRRPWKATYVWPGVQGATNWYSPSYSPQTSLFYLTVWENKGWYLKGEPEYIAGQPLYRQRAGYRFGGRSGLRRDSRAQSQNRREDVGVPDAHQALVGSDDHRQPLIFGGNGGWMNRSAREDTEAYFFALDAENGKELWRINLGGTMSSQPDHVHGKRQADGHDGGRVGGLYFRFAVAFISVEEFDVPDALAPATMGTRMIAPDTVDPGRPTL